MFDFLTSVIGFFVAIGILVVFHELGHYSVARWCGVKVLRFSIGFGKPLLSRQGRDGTLWTIGWLPLGGYVRMLDERDPTQVAPAVSASRPEDTGPGPAVSLANAVDAAADDNGPPLYRIDPADLPHAFNRQSVGKRFAIVAAGPIANFILAILLFACLSLAGQPEPEAILGTPTPGSVAARVGIVSGEQVLAVRVTQADGSDDGDAAYRNVRSWPELRHWLMHDAGSDASTVVLRTRRNGDLTTHALSLASLRADASSQNNGEATGQTDLSTRLGLLPGGATPLIAGVQAGTPAAKAGLREGDMVLRVQGEPVDDANALVLLMRSRPGRDTALDIRRGAQDLTVHVVPEVVGDPKGGASYGRIGAALGMRLPLVDVHYGPLQSLQMAAGRTWDVASFSVKMFGRMLTGQASLRNLSGPVTIADYAGRSARMGVSAFVSFLALVSISLGVLNLLPIPVLDGGHLLYYAVEALTGRAVSDRWQGILQRAGLICIVALSAVALFNDLTRLAHS
jgi:regulator of sigma E protease